MGTEFVEFPAIGLNIPVNRIAFTIRISNFSFDIYTYALIITGALLLALILGIRQSTKYGIAQDDLVDLLIYTIPISIICLRLYYVIFSWDYYKDDLLRIINFRDGGLAIYGAIIGAFGTVFVYTKLKKMNPFKVLDFGVPYLLLGQAIGRWGNFVNQEAFGCNTALPWGMTSNAISEYLAFKAQELSTMGIAVDPLLPVHPTFLYESLWCFAIAIVLFIRRRNPSFTGEVFLLYLIGYGTGRAFIEGLRVDSLMFGQFRISQLLSILLVVLCIFLWAILKKRSAENADASPDVSLSDTAIDLESGAMQMEEPPAAEAVEASDEGAGIEQLEQEKNGKGKQENA